MYYVALRLCAEVILEHYDPEDRMKMELANMYGLLKIDSLFSMSQLTTCFLNIIALLTSFTEYLLLSIAMTNHWLKL